MVGMDADGGDGRRWEGEGCGGEGRLDWMVTRA
jgi:hypothetical protein